MTTALQLIDLAFRDSGVFGVGQTPTATDYADALLRMNMMISQWNRRRWLIYHLVDTVAACDSAKISYTVGAAQDFNVARPDKIEACFIRQVVLNNPTPIDWMLEPINSYEEYAQIALKTLRAAPSEYFFYDSGFPSGKLYPWPIPNSQYELHILTKAVLQSFAATSDVIALPPEYEEVIYLNLAVRNRMAYQLPSSKDLNGLAKASLNTIRGSNFQVGRLSMPAGINKGPAYNIYSDRGQ